VLAAEQAEKYPKAPNSDMVELDVMEALDPGLLASRKLYPWQPGSTIHEC
jgi:hypothetical protein